MPKDKFAMKANLKTLEPFIQKYWKNNNVFLKRLNKNKKNLKAITIFDGPPYANGKIHIGHALNKILKDCLVRFYNLNDFYCDFKYIWDTHGFPIEYELIKNSSNLSKEDIRKKCRKYAIEQVNEQKKNFSLLGLFADNFETILTLDAGYVEKELNAFWTLFKNNYIYKDLKPICWSWSSETAIANAEIKYIKKESVSIYVKFKLLENNKFPKNTYLLIWTTTPWTLPGNFGIAINPNILYDLVLYCDEYFIVAKELEENIFKDKKFEIIKTFNAKLLKNLVYYSNLNNKNNKVYFGNYVTIDTGTGLVHISPFHGEEDFLLGKENEINSYPVVNKKGMMINSKYEGIFYLKSNNLIIEDLRKVNLIFDIHKYVHEYPYDWRTNKPTFYLAMEQWFINIKKNISNIVNEIEKTTFIPNWGKQKLLTMVNGRSEWCISRQRYWGVPIIAFYNKNNKLILNEKLFNYGKEFILKNGVDKWFEADIFKILPNNVIKENKIYKKENDILDVWVDSGLANYILQEMDYYNFNKNNSTIFIEGQDQFRGWFNSSFILNVNLLNKRPTDNIYIHGFVLDEKNEKMSKSKGNIISPISIINDYGADILRLWALSANFQDNIKIGKTSLKSSVTIYRKIRNTLRFIVNNIDNEDVLKNADNFFQNKKITVNNEWLNPFDKYVLYKLNKLIKNSTKYYQNFKINKIIYDAENYCVNVLSNNYFDWSKDILYVYPKNHFKRRNIQYTMLIIGTVLSKILSSIIPHTCEEWFLSFKNLNNKSIFHCEFPLIVDYSYSEEELNIAKLINTKYVEEFSRFWSIATGDVELKNINFENKLKKIIECNLYIKVKDEYKHCINKEELEKYFSYSNICEINTNTNINKKMIAYDSLNDDKYNMNKQKLFERIVLLKMDGFKCERCWKYFFYNKLKKFKENSLCNFCYETINSKI